MVEAHRPSLYTIYGFQEFHVVGLSVMVDVSGGSMLCFLQWKVFLLFFSSVLHYLAVLAVGRAMSVT